MSTPLRAQYVRLKRPFPDAVLLFRLGDFYEAYDEDARVVARELGLVLAVREFGQGERVPLCPIPYHAVDGHIRRLVARGYKVAIAEQIGDPHTARGLVEREVVRVVTPMPPIEAHHHPSSDHIMGPSGAEPDGTGMPLSGRRTVAPVPSTSMDASVTGPASAPGADREERTAAPAVQLALFDLPTGGDDRRR